MSSVDPGGPWKAGRREFKLEGTLTGRENPWSGWGTVTTQDQSMSGTVRFSGYKLAVEAGGDTQHDYFGVYGNMNHGIGHGNTAYQPYDPGKNVPSVGYYANHMSLVLELLTDGDVWDSGPASTVGSNSTGFNIGGNLTGGQMGDAGIAQVGVPANPKPASYAGYSWTFGAIFQVPKGTNLQLRVAPRVRWEFDWTRGIENDTKTWEDDKTYTYQPA